MHTPQKETPAGGGNHPTGVNTYDSGVIVRAGEVAVNNQAIERKRTLSLAKSHRLLNDARNFAAMNAPFVLWQKRITIGEAQVLVRIEWPGVLAVYDTKTSEALAKSVPGEFTTLQKK